MLLYALLITDRRPDLADESAYPWRVGVNVRTDAQAQRVGPGMTQLRPTADPEQVTVGQSHLVALAAEPLQAMDSH